MPHRLRRTAKTSRRRRASVAAGLVVALALAVPASASALWGAIAVNTNTTQFGVSYNYSSQHKAKVRAKNECAGHCKTAVVVFSQCGATVYNSHGFYSGVGQTKHKAFERASHRAPGHATRLAYVCSG